MLHTNKKEKPSKYTFFNVFERFFNTIVLWECGDGETTRITTNILIAN